MSGNKRILLADDSPNILNALTDILETSGYEVASVGGGAALIEKAKAWRPHLIIADLMMPDIYGSAAVATLQAEPGLEKVPVIFLTAMIEEQARLIIPPSTGGRLLTKPVEVSKLLSAITELLA